MGDLVGERVGAGVGRFVGEGVVLEATRKSY